jgi:hypothetical protein
MSYDQHPIAGRAGPIAPLARLSISSFVALLASSSADEVHSFVACLPCSNLPDPRNGGAISRQVGCLTRWRSAKMADLAASTSGFPVDFT